MLQDGDSTDAVGILRHNSNSSSARNKRPISGVSALSGETSHYMPARFAGVVPITAANRQHAGFDTERIERDPFSVHRVVYPDPAPGSEDAEGRYIIFPDPVPPPVPMRMEQWTSPQPPVSISTTAVMEPPPVLNESRSARRVKVPALAPQEYDSVDGHTAFGGGPVTALAYARPQSPESHYDEESVYSAAPRRTFLIDRRPDKRPS